MKVSVIIPCFNAEKDIGECLESALQQSYSNIEIIVVDNNSTDRSIAIIQQYVKKWSKKIFLHQELKQGAPAARNKGLNVASGQWLQFLDADDILLPHKIAHQVQLVKNSVRVDLVVGGYIYQFEDGKKVQISVSEENQWLAFIQNKLGITSSILWKKEMVGNAGGWDEQMSASQETELIMQMLKQGASITRDNSFRTIVRQRKNSISNSKDQANVWAVLIDQKIRATAFTKEKNPDIYQKNKMKINAAIITYLFKLGIYDLPRASAIYNELFKSKPVLLESPSGKFLKYSYKLFGFKTGTILYKYYLIMLRFINRYPY